MSCDACMRCVASLRYGRIIVPSTGEHVCPACASPDERRSAADEVRYRRALEAWRETLRARAERVTVARIELRRTA